MSAIARVPPSALLAASALLATACGRGGEADSAVPEPARVPAGAAFGGELVLRGDVAFAPEGSATIAIVARGGDAPVFARSWDLGDPAWRAGADGRRLYFALDARDAWPGAAAGIAEEMELVARFDPDGNPATDEAGSARVRVPARTGARDLAVDLVLGRQVAASAPADATGGG